MTAENLLAQKRKLKVLPACDPRTITVPERFDIDRLQIAAALSEDSLETAKVKSYLKSAPSHCCHVHYEDPGVGRLTATAKGEPSCVQMTMNGQFRAAACLGLYHDVDIEDCAMTILVQVCQAHNLPCAAMEAFSRERKEVLKHLQSQGMTRRQAKAIQNRCVFGGCIEGLNKTYDIPQSVLAMHKEVQQITPQLLTLYPVFHQVAVERRGSRYWNLSGVALSLLFQTCEKHLILALHDFFHYHRAYEPGALVHDGLHVKSREDWRSAGTIPPEILVDAAAAAEKATGFRIRLAIKSFDVSQRILDAHIANDTVDAGQYILQTLGADLVQDEQAGTVPRILYKHSRIWITDRKSIEAYVLNRIHAYDVFFRSNGSLFSHTRNMRQAEVLLKYIMNNATPRPGFCKQLWESSLGKICYNDGWYDFEQAQFYPWTDESVEQPLTTIIIPRPFPAQRPTQDERSQLLQIVSPVFNDIESMQECVMEFFARAMAGQIVDKQWMAVVGERDSGKGLLLCLMIAAFSVYVRSCNSENFLYKGVVKDAAKAQSWMLDFEFARLCYSNEITISPNGDTTLDGNQLKRFTSGGDELCARKNFKDEVYFRTQAHQMVCCNDLPTVLPSDAKQTAIMLDMQCKFVPKDDPLLLQTPANRHQIAYRVANPEVKKLAQTPAMINAFTWMVLESYRPHAVRVPMSMQEATDQFRSNDGENETDLFYALFDFTDSLDDRVAVADVKADVIKNHIAMTPQRYNKLLRAKGCTQATVKGQRCWRGLLRLSTMQDTDDMSGLL